MAPSSVPPTSAVSAALAVAFCAVSAAHPAATAVPAEFPNRRDFDVVLYGATGCVGGFAAKHLASQDKLRWAVAGRNASSVKAVADELCAAPSTKSCPHQIVASLDDGSDPEVWVRRTRMVATAAGPFSKNAGDRLLAACARLGVHYTDTGGEFYWQREMIDKYHSVAKVSGARIVISSGFSSLASDLGAQLALNAMGEVVSSTPVSIDAWLECYNGGTSAGAIKDIGAMRNASFPKEWARDPYVLAPQVRKEDRVDSSLTGMGFAGWDWHEGPVAQNILGPNDARLLRRTFATLGDWATLRVGATPKMYAAWGAFLAAHPGSWSSLATCPTQAVFDGGSWQMRVRASDGPFVSEVLLSGDGDPGYKFTSGGLAEVALCLAGRVPGCLRRGHWGSHAPAGVLTAMGALDPQAVRGRLEQAGLLRLSAKRSVSSADAAQVLV